MTVSKTLEDCRATRNQTELLKRDFSKCMKFVLSSVLMSTNVRCLTAKRPSFHQTCPPSIPPSVRPPRTQFEAGPRRPSPWQPLPAPPGDPEAVQSRGVESLQPAPCCSRKGLDALQRKPPGGVWYKVEAPGAAPTLQLSPLDLTEVEKRRRDLVWPRAFLALQAALAVAEHGAELINLRWVHVNLCPCQAEEEEPP